MRVSEETTENSQQLSRQAGMELDTSRLPVLRAEPLSHWLGDCRVEGSAGRQAFHSNKKKKHARIQEKSFVTGNIKMLFFQNETIQE